MKTKPRKQPTEAQKAAAAAKRDKIAALWQRIAEMPESDRVAMANKIGAVVSCEGRALSVCNTLLLAMQCPAVSIVGGFRQWQGQGRQVRKGEKGLSLWVPTSKPDGQELPAGVLCLPAPGQSTAGGDAPALDATGSTERRSRFILGTVFDISQTDPAEAQGPEIEMEIVTASRELAYA